MRAPGAWCLKKAKKKINERKKRKRKVRERERERTEVEAPWLETINHRPGWDLCWGRWIPILTSWTPFGRVPRGASDFDCLGIKFTQFYLVSRFAFLSTDSNSLFLLFPFCLQQSSFWLPFFLRLSNRASLRSLCRNFT